MISSNYGKMYLIMDLFLFTIFSNVSRSEGLAGELWIEVGSVTLGPLIIEAAMSLPTPEQNLHLVQHR